ncbi:MAG: GDP-mannose 4,6-dehydratase, partial [Myxococcota bacterium]
QFPEKLLPLMILNALEGKPLPIYGDGGHVRDWLFVEDHCRGLLAVLRGGTVGEKYNLGGDCERSNLEMVDALCEELERAAPVAENAAMARAGVSSYAELRSFVEDRPGHDRRYAIDATRARDELGWAPQHDLRSGLALTVRWYLENAKWCRAVQAGRYGGERLGLAVAQKSRA